MGLFQIALRPVPLPAAVKFGLVFAATLTICLFTYRWFVEGRAIGRLLDGEWPWRALRRPEPAVLSFPEAAPVREAA